MKIKVSQAKIICSFSRKHKFLKEGCVDLHAPNMNKVKWVWQQQRTAMLWEFLIAEIESINYLVTEKKVWNSYFLSEVLFLSFWRHFLSRKNYSPGHNILELYNILVHIRFPTSKVKLDIRYSKIGIRVASRLAERLKT